MESYLAGLGGGEGGEGAPVAEVGEVAEGGEGRPAGLHPAALQGGHCNQLTEYFSVNIAQRRLSKQAFGIAQRRLSK